MSQCRLLSEPTVPTPSCLLTTLAFAHTGNMDLAGGGWNLCAHAGGRRLSGGSRHWYGNFDARLVNFTNAATEVSL